MDPDTGKKTPFCHNGMIAKVCNLPRPPRCECSEGSFPSANGGMLCETDGGDEVHDCENSDEWNLYDSICDRIVSGEALEDIIKEIRTGIEEGIKGEDEEGIEDEDEEETEQGIEEEIDEGIEEEFEDSSP
ncbi:hypothetical protein BGZ95_010384 [Linnemannia exigua]|uniref:Uncharacterized protein n=1 Tax=Linnemannia exigua TaxID=604196 RepID=A0AAD4DBF4_9FUNG|nr:hypothetical protein BGZ95_010384 [Linnemannia exigua]